MEEMVGLVTTSSTVEVWDCFKVWYMMGWLGFLVVAANRWGQVFRHCWGSPSEEQHVDWVLVNADQFNQGSEVNKSGLSLDLSLESKAEKFSKLGAHVSDRGAGNN